MDSPQCQEEEKVKQHPASFVSTDGSHVAYETEEEQQLAEASALQIKRYQGKKGKTDDSTPIMTDATFSYSGCPKKTIPGCVKLDEKVAFCLPTAGRRTQFFHPY